MTTTSTRELTAPEVLRVVAEELAYEKALFGAVFFPFLCNRIKNMAWQDQVISEETAERIVARIKEYLPEGQITFDGGNDADGDFAEERIILALWVALELEEEDAAGVADAA